MTVSDTYKRICMPKLRCTCSNKALCSVRGPHPCLIRSRVLLRATEVLTGAAMHAMARSPQPSERLLQLRLFLMNA
jgi:hypothetical protein